MKRRGFKITAAAVGLAVITAACSSAGVDSPDAQAPEPTVVATQSGASELRAVLTAGLQEHVYLAGIALNTALTTGPESDATAAAVATLDENSVALSQAIESVYEGAGDPFLELWRTHIGFFVDYTLAGASGDADGQREAKRALDGYRDDFAAFISGANPNLPKDAVKEELKPHVVTVFAAIDALIDGSPKAFNKLRKAAAHMPHTAATLAGGIAAQFPTTYTGDVNGPAATLRATLTAGLQEHVYLAGIALNTALTTGLESKATAAAVDTLDKNSVALSEAIDSVYPGAGETFLPLWRKHIGFFVDYTVAGASGDPDGQMAAKDALVEYREDFAAFISGANPNLPKDAVIEELQPHVMTVFAAIDALIDGSTDAFTKLRVAANVMPNTAATLAGGIATQFPERFGS